VPAFYCTAQGGTAGAQGTTCADIVCASNDNCGNAIAVEVPSSTAGSTTNASKAGWVPTCEGASSDDAPDVWYTVVGTGNTLTATTCNGPWYDGQMEVFCNDCNSWSCVGGSDDGCGPGYGQPSTVTWCSRAGVTYLIRIYGWQGATGDFQLDLSDDGTPCESTDPCSPTGACCVHSACIPDQTAADCATIGGAYEGDNTTCAPTNPCPRCAGDCNCDGLINFDDINYFVSALAGSEAGWTSYYSGQHGGDPPPCTFMNNDADGNTTVNFDDINPFVSLLVAAPECP
jgi:hypothetical protein